MRSSKSKLRLTTRYTKNDQNEAKTAYIAVTNVLNTAALDIFQMEQMNFSNKHFMPL